MEKYDYLILFLCVNDTGLIVTNGQIVVSLSIKITTPSQIQDIEKNLKLLAIPQLIIEEKRKLVDRVMITSYQPI